MRPKKYLNGQEDLQFHTRAFIPRKKALAANQGLYSGFLAAGLIWSLFISDLFWQRNIALFFLSCILTAAIYRALTAGRAIFFKQGLPALAALVLVLWPSC
ncbi:DUF1304 domain-containing protein [Flavobacterium gelatinilyticum]|uniref:DUF1304 domain-containing protein n=1 Tax=Flavobacterium gelatinilyticum TaxID=3003260 RepID=UPI002480EC21|nr:DUF1304 domain-containing protein [Flavobacterium gelatinilyticum]